MKKQELIQIIKEEIALQNLPKPAINESYDLDAVKYSASVKSQVDKLVSAIEKTPNLTKTAVASIFNDIILALGLNKTEISMIMNAIKIDRSKYKF